MKFVFGNFKMNGSLNKIGDYVDSLNELSPDILEKVCVFFPFPFFGFLGDCRFKYGAQDCSFAESGAYTGDTSPILLKECNCDYVLIGHSERRKHHHEDGKTILQKTVAAVKAGLKPVVCIGETIEEKENRFEVLRHQLSIFTPREEKVVLDNLIIAYEPVWAIGSGVIPTKEEIRGTCEFISEDMIKVIGKKVSVLYGGSVNETNATEILGIENLDGVLIGKASLYPTEFKKIALISQEY